MFSDKNDTMLFYLLPLIFDVFRRESEIDGGRGCHEQKNWGDDRDKYFPMGDME